MKNNIAILSAFVFVLSSFMSGCTSAESQLARPTIQNEETTAAQPASEASMISPAESKSDIQDFFGGMKPISSDYETGGTNRESLTYTPLVIEKENLFSNRDLESAPDLSEAVQISVQNSSEYTITTAGVYILTGEASDFTVKVEAGKDDKVQIVLNNASIANTDFPVIYVKSADKCFVTSLGQNSLTVRDQFVSDGDINTDAVIYSKDDLTLNGSGGLTIISAAGNGISTKDDLRITGGKYNISSALDAVEANDSISIYGGEFIIESNKDAFHCENDEKLGSVYIKDGSFNITAKDDGIQATSYLVIDGGNYTITAAEALEATYVQLNDGKYNINASDDGINASGKCDDYDVIIEINGGEITVVMGAGDTDGLDANGIIVVNGGTIDVTGRSTFDADRGTIYNGGTIIINGTVTDSIPSSMGGHGGMGNKGNRNQGDRPTDPDSAGFRNEKGKNKGYIVIK